MANPLTDFRTALAAIIEPVLGMPVRPGKLNGPLEQTAACIYSVGRSEDPTVVREEDLEVRVRVFRDHRPRSTNPAMPRDPTELEEWVQQIMAVVGQHYGGDDLAGTWYARPISGEVDDDAQGIEVVIIGHRVGVLDC